MPDRPPRFDGLPARQAVDRSVASLLPYAELLRDTLDRRLYPSAGTDLVAPSTDRLFDDGLAVVMEAMIADRLAALTPAELVTVYRQVRGDDALAARLGRLAQLDAEALTRRTRLARAAAEARIRGRVLLGELDPGEVLTIGLFDPSRPELAARRFRDNQEVRPLHRTLQVRLTDPDAGAVEVLRDTWTGAIWSEALRGPTPVEAFTAGRLGTRPASDTTSAPRPEITLHAPLTLVLATGRTVGPNQVVGFVELLDGTVLLDAP